MVQIKPGEMNKKNYISSEEYAKKIPAKIGISPNTVRSVSQYRRAALEQEVEQGKFGNDNKKNGAFDLSPAGFVTSSGKKNLTKNASSAAGGWQGNGGTIYEPTEQYSPLLINSNISLPQNRLVINAWSRAYFALYGIVQNPILLHSTYPISKLNIKCPNKTVEEFFQNMIEEIDLMNICVQIAQEYWIIGEVFPYAELDENSRKWSRIFLQNPDYIDVQRTAVPGEPIISLKPDDNLKKICTGNRPTDIQQRQRINKSIVEHVRRGENIPLDNFYVSHLARKINPYNVRGTGIILSSFRQLMLLDKLRESKYVQADDMINPWTLVKIGGEDYKPQPADLEHWRQIFESGHNNKNFKIFTHDKLTVERVGASGGIIDISNDVTQLLKEILIGLMAPSVLMDGGADTTYQNGGVALDALRQRYMTFRNMLALWLRRKIFAPISQINEFYEKKNGKNVLIVPDVEWNHMSLFDMGDYVGVLKELANPEHKVVSYQTLFRSLGLTYEDEKQKIRQEAIDEAIMEKEKASLTNMSLTEIRALTPGQEIPEKKDEYGQPVPGQTVPGEEGGEVMPGMPPDMGAAAPPAPGSPPK